jgi:hypothetical protein
MKSLLTSLLLTATLIPFTAHATDAVTLVATNLAGAEGISATLTLAAGESAEIVTYLPGITNISSRLRVTAAEREFFIPLYTGSQATGTAFPNLSQKLLFAGPATIVLTTGGPGYPSGYSMTTMAVTRVASPSTTPSNAAVIPEDANGQYQVLLESSTDMVTWTPANPGTYSGNVQKRFFRTRIVKQ